MTNSIIPASRFQDAVEACVNDMRGQDENFYQTAQLAKIYWWAGRIRTLEYYLASAEIRTAEHKRFMEAVAQEYGMDVRRLYDARQRYLKVYKKGDSLKETVERAHSEFGGWSRILPSGKKDEEPVEPEEHTHVFICTKCGAHQQS